MIGLLAENGYIGVVDKIKHTSDMLRSVAKLGVVGTVGIGGLYYGKDLADNIETNMIAADWYKRKKQAETEAMLNVAKNEASNFGDSISQKVRDFKNNLFGDDNKTPSDEPPVPPEEQLKENINKFKNNFLYVFSFNN